MKKEIKIRNVMCFVLLVSLMCCSLTIFSMSEGIDSLARSVESFPNHSKIPDDNLKQVSSITTFSIHALAALGVVALIILLNIGWSKMSDSINQDIKEVISRDEDE